MYRINVQFLCSMPFSTLSRLIIPYHVQESDTICFNGILDCVHMSFYTHNVSLVKHFCNADKLWMLLVLELQRSTAIDRSQYLEGCVSNMSDWGYWNYAECTFDISGIDDYRNCSVNSQPATANPKMHLPAWVIVLVVILALCACLMGSINLIACVVYCQKRNKL